jgi:hypothetical protein
VYPLFAALAGISVWWILSNVDSRYVRTLTKAVLAVGFLLPSVATVQLFPYQQVYTSEWSLFDKSTSDNAFDNQGVSSKQTQEWVNRNYQNQKIATIFEQTFVPYLENNELVSTADSNLKLYAQVWRPALIPDYFGDCKRVYAVTRSQFWKKYLLSYVRDCSLPAR